MGDVAKKGLLLRQLRLQFAEDGVHLLPLQPRHLIRHFASTKRWQILSEAKGEGR